MIVHNVTQYSTEQFSLILQTIIIAQILSNGEEESGSCSSKTHKQMLKHYMNRKTS